VRGCAKRPPGREGGEWGENLRGWVYSSEDSFCLGNGTGEDQSGRALGATVEERKDGLSSSITPVREKVSTS